MMYKLSYGTFENSHYITASHVTRFHNAARGFRVSLPHDTPKNLGSWHKFGYAWEHSQRHRIVSTNQFRCIFLIDRDLQDLCFLKGMHIRTDITFKL